MNNKSIQIRIRKNDFLIGLGLLLCIALSIWSNLNNLTLRNAVEGFTPLEYVHRKTSPENYIKNFDDGILSLKTSLLFNFYEVAYNAGMDPELFQRIVIVSSVIFFAAVLWYFSRTILPKAALQIHLLTVVFGLATDALNHNLAYFASFAVLNSGQMYAPASICAVFAIANAFQRSWIGCFVTVGIAFCLHAILGSIAGLICGTILLTELDQLKLRNAWIGGASGLLITGAWYLLSIQPTLDGFKGMDAETWVAWARFGNYHWFPFSRHILGIDHSRTITPLLAILILALIRIIDSPLSAKNRRMWYAAILSTLVLTCIGLTVSIIPISPTLIKLAFHRASMFLLLLCLPLALHLLLADIESGNTVKRFLALVLLATPVAGGGIGFPLLYAELRFGVDLWQCARKRALPVYLAFGTALLALCLSAYIIQNSSVIWTDSAFISKPPIVIAASIIVGILIVLRRVNRNILGQSIVVLATLSCLSFGLANMASAIRPQSHRKSAFLDVQLWAKNYTLKNSLFMMNPAGPYGWRDYSQRSSFGVLREWIQTSWLYTGNLEKFDEGMRRVKLLGIDPNEYLQHSLDGRKASIGPEYRKLVSRVKDRYFSLSEHELNDLAEKEKIDYFIFEKKMLKKPRSRIVYENKHFIVCNPSG